MHRFRVALRALGLVAGAVAALAVAPAAGAVTTTDITSSGPLANIWVGSDLSCQVGYAGSSSNEFYPSDQTQGDCGTFVSDGTNLYGPDFQSHASSATPFANGSLGYVAMSGTQNGGVQGSGTAASPYQVSTTATLGNSLQISQTDSYAVGGEYYQTTIILRNLTRSPITGVKLYHAGDCYLQDSDIGYGFVDTRTSAPACTENPNNSPGAQVEQFSAITPLPTSYVEGVYASVWTAIGSQAALANTCDCTTQEDNGAGVEWDLTVPASGSTSVSMLSNFSATGQLVGYPAVVTTPASSVSTTGATLTGTANPANSPVSSCAFQWGTTTAYGSTLPCAQSPGSGNGAVPVSAVLAGLAPGTAYHYQLVVTNANGTSYGDDQTFTTGQPSAAPVVQGAGVPVVGTSTAAFSGAVDAQGLDTTAHFEYGFDPRYAGGGPVVYDQVTPGVSVGSGFGPVPVSASVSGLVPNAVYHVRLVATNSAGTTVGGDVVFTTRPAGSPAPPVLGKSFDVKPVSGVVLVKLPGGKSGHASGGELSKGVGFIPLTQARNLPVGTQVDARRGTLELTAAAVPKTKHAKAAVQTGTFSGGAFKLGQARSGLEKGLTTLALSEGSFAGGPSYASCSVGKKAHVVGVVAKLSPKILQTLKARDNHGNFKTTGRYSAATVRGTVWSISDRCDGTLTKVSRGTVDVFDFHRRKTVVVRAGHSYLALAKAPKGKKK